MRDARRGGSAAAGLKRGVLVLKFTPRIIPPVPRSLQERLHVNT